MRWIRRFFSGVIILLLIIVAASLAISYFYNDEVTQKIKNQLNTYVTAKIQVEDYQLSLLKKFPYAAVEFNKVVAFVPDEFNTRDMNKPVSDTLFAFDKIFAKFQVFDIFSKTLSIKAFHADDGQLNLCVNQAGEQNFVFWQKPEKPTNNQFNFQLQHVQFTDTKLKFIHQTQQLSLRSQIDHIKFNGKFYKDQYTLSAQLHTFVHSFRINDVDYINSKATDIAAKLSVSDNEYVFKEGNLKIADVRLNLSGYLKRLKEEGSKINVNIKSPEIKIGSLISVLPSSIKDQISGFRSSGSCSFKTSCQGILSRHQSPHIVGMFDVTNGEIVSSSSPGRITDINMKSYFSNGEDNSPKTSKMILKSYSGRLADSKFHGQGKIINFNRPELSLAFNGHLNGEDIQQFFQLDTFATLQGTLDANMQLSCYLPGWEEIQADDVERFQGDGELTLQNMAFQLKDSPVHITALNGNLQIDNNVTKINPLDFKVNGDAFLIKGSVKRLIKSLLHPRTHLWFNGDLTAQEMHMENYFSNNKQQPQQDTEVNMPSHLHGQLHFTIKKLFWDHFRGTRIAGDILYEPRSAKLTDLSLQSMEGRVKGDALLEDQGSRFKLESDLSLNSLNVRKMFQSFDNFGQENLQSKHLKGTLDGNIQFATALTSSLTILKKSLASQADLKISDGELIHYKPMLELSKFIEVSELKHINFSTLENTFYIRNQKLIIPEMDIHSSAIDITGSGTHKFDNTFDYHVKILLSELLANKARKAKQKNEKFGVIEEDGVGRTSLYLAVQGTKEDINVTYDRQKVKEVLNKRFKAENRELKRAFHKEFGWYKDDPDLQKATEKDEKQKDFVIEWDDRSPSEQKPQEPPKNKKSKDTEDSDLAKEKNEKHTKSDKQEFNIEWDDQ